MEKATKGDQGKYRFSLVPKLALRETIKVFELGAIKYGAHNYALGLEHMRYVDALYRHLDSYLTFEDIDPESQRHHLAHVACNALMLLENILTNKGEDDRNPIYRPKEMKKIERKKYAKRKILFAEHAAEWKKFLKTKNKKK
jgi:hypothetical protein